MVTQFRCVHCDTTLVADGAGGEQVACGQCGRRMSIPEGLASLPEPPWPDQVDAPRRVGAMGHLAGSFPWVMSIFLNVTVLLTLALIPVFMLYADDSREIPVPGPVTANPTLRPPIEGIWKPVEEIIREGPKHPEREFEHPNAADDLPSPSGKELDVAIIGEGIHGLPGSTGVGIGKGGPHGDGFLRRTPPSSNARHFVFLIDRSGSMYGSFQTLQAELKRSISDLQGHQTFHVIFFSSARGERPAEIASGRMTPATDSYKIQAVGFVEAIGTGRQTVCAPALRRAFEVLAPINDGGGKVIYLLTDGQLNDWPEPLEVARQLNRANNVSIQTFLYSVTPDSRARQMLEALANENAGQTYYVNPHGE